MCTCVRACVRACVRVCVCARVRVVCDRLTGFTQPLSSLDCRLLLKCFQLLYFGSCEEQLLHHRRVSCSCSCSVPFYPSLFRASGSVFVARHVHYVTCPSAYYVTKACHSSLSCSCTRTATTPFLVRILTSTFTERWRTFCATNAGTAANRARSKGTITYDVIRGRWNVVLKRPGRHWRPRSEESKWRRPIGLRAVTAIV